MHSFDESRFKAQVASAISKMQTILDNTRAPQYPADVPHVYDDKYGLAEFIANTAIAAGHECLAQLGLTAAGMQQLVAWGRDRAVTLRFEGTETCTYLRETSRKVESSSVVHESTLFGKSSSKVVTTVVEHFWQFKSSWQLSAFVGTGSAPGEKVSLLGRQGACEIMTSQKTTPRVESRVVSPIDVRLTWLLAATSSEMLPQFTIARVDPACRTPRRNPQVENALSFWRGWYSWSQQVHRYLLHELAPIHADHGLDVNALTDAQLFVPVAPLFEHGHKGPTTAPHLRTPPEPKLEQLLLKAAGEEEEAKNDDNAAAAAAVVPVNEGSALLPVGDVNKFLSEQRRSLAAKTAELAKVFPTREAGKLLTQVEAGVIVLLLHIQRLGQAFSDGVDYIELMLRRQLIAAVGKELTVLDFANFMRFHNRKIFRSAFEPKPFCHAVRRPEHYPEGTIAIESASPGDGVAAGNPEPILTHCRKWESAQSWPMHFAIDAATNVVFQGERYLHGYVSQQFAGAGSGSLTLTARARQFSSFIVLVGVLGGAELFQPKHAFLVKDKDEFSIPLKLDVLPSAGEFKDAIESLSPEQQRFAKAIRAMQLEGSMFGVLVIQIKPQLEKLLRLPDDALTKEIQLTQDLQELFVKYQIPSDLLSYSGEESAHVSTKVAAVQAQVNAMHRVIQSAKDRQLEERQQEAAYNVADVVANAPSISSFSYGGGSPMPLCPPPSSCPPPPMAMRSMAAPSPGRSRPMLASSSASNALSLSPAAAPAPMKRAALSHAPSPKPTSTVPTSTSTPSAAASSSKPAARGETEASSAEDAVSGAVDFTQLPVALDAKLLALDPEQALRPTIITAGLNWTKRAQKSLLSEASTAGLNVSEQERAKKEAFDLLDALSRSGSLSIDCAELHVVMAATHNFAASLIDTVIERNVNPIEKVERSALLVATAVHDQAPSALIKPEQRERIALYSATKLFAIEQRDNRLLAAAGGADAAAAGSAAAASAQ